jgi:hypothetical protein
VTNWNVPMLINGQMPVMSQYAACTVATER